MSQLARKVATGGQLSPLNDELQRLNGELLPMKEDLQRLNGELLPMKEDLQRMKSQLLPVEEDLQRLNGELLPMKVDVLAFRHVLFNEDCPANRAAMIEALRSLSPREQMKLMGQQVGRIDRKEQDIRQREQDIRQREQDIRQQNERIDPKEQDIRQREQDIRKLMERIDEITESLWWEDHGAVSSWAPRYRNVERRSPSEDARSVRQTQVR